MTTPAPFPFERTCPYDPPSEYADLAPVAPVLLRDGTKAWLVLGHAEARQVLTDPRISADRTDPGFPHVMPMIDAGQPFQTFAGMDDPAHAYYRRMVLSRFTVRRTREMRNQVESAAHGLVDEMLRAGPPADLVHDYALALPSIVICHVLGVPYRDHDFFQRCTRELVTARTEEDVSRATKELVTYLDALVDDKVAHQGDDLLSQLLVEQVQPGNLTKRQLVHMAVLLLGAGHETTANTIALGALTFFQHDAQLAAMRAHPEHVAGVVEELLRFLSVTDTVVNRVATEDLELGGVRIRAGEGVIVSTAAANRDGRVFPDPDRFDVTRTARHHVAFGYGVHQCLGQNLARLELEVAFTVLFDRIPGLRPAVPAEDVSIKSSPLVHGLVTLPVTW